MAKEKIKKPFYKKWWFILIAAIFILGGIGNLLESDEAKQKREDEKIAVENERKEKEQKKKQEEQQKKEEAKEEERKKNRNIDDKIQEDNKNVDSASVTDGVLQLKSEGKTTFSENTLFHSVYDLFEAMHDGFEDEGVDKVEVILTTTMVDSKGNESDDEVITYEYSRKSFEELNYDKFANMAFGQQWRILNESDAYWIHPGIYKNLKDEYTGNLTHGISK